MKDTMKAPVVNLEDFPSGFGPFYGEFISSYAGYMKPGHCLAHGNPFLVYNGMIYFLKK